MRRKVLLLSGLAALGLGAGISSPASASVLTYNLIPNSSDIIVSASITGGVFGTTGTTVDFDGSASWQVNLTSGSMTLDTGTPALDAFSFGDSSAGPETISAGGVTFGTLSLTKIVIQSTANPDAPLTGSNPYGLNTTNVTAGANYSVTPTGGSTRTGTLSNPGTLTIAGNIATGGAAPVSFLQSDTIELGTGSFTYLGTTYTLSVKGDTNFEGETPVPLPSSLWLLATGLGLLGFGWTRQRPAPC